MAQTYRDPLAHARMAAGTCPECGETAGEHSGRVEFWLRSPGCDLLPRGGALPPDPQPDPQVVAWMRGYLRANPHRAEAIGTSKARASKAWLTAHGHKTLAASPHSLRELIDAYDAALSHPLTVADIPAGQGAASLYLRDGHLYHRGADGRIRLVEYGGWHEAVDAMDALLAAHLPTITTDDALDVDPLFDTPQITTDTKGRHWCQGREYVAVDVDGELDYQPKETPVTETPAPTRPGLTIDHLDFARRLIDTATHAGVAIRYCCWTGWDWDVMTTPELDDAAGTAFLAALDIGDVGEPSQLAPNKNRSILAGPQFDGAVRLWVAPIPTTIDTTEEST